MFDLDDLPHDLAALVRVVDRRVFETFDAEAEIEAAMARHPDAADPIWHALLLLRPTTGLLTRAPVVFQAHCRELLERVAAGGDTRPATAVECCVALCEVSTAVPLNTVAAGLYHRVWALAGLPDMGATAHYEALRSSEIDDAEAKLRAKLAQPWRQLARPIVHRTLCPATLAAPRPRDPGFFDQHGRWVPQGLFDLEAS